MRRRPGQFSPYGQFMTRARFRLSHAFIIPFVPRKKTTALLFFLLRAGSFSAIIWAVSGGGTPPNRHRAFTCDKGGSLSMKKIRVGIIGCGGRCQSHIHSLLQMDDVEIVAIA